MGSLLDAGCGTNAFSRFIASRCGDVLAIDLSPGMIRQACKLSAPRYVRFEVGDVLSADLQPATYDAVVSIAALDHMDLEQAIFRLSQLLRRGGTLVILDLMAPSGPGDRLMGCLAASSSSAVRFMNTGRLFASRRQREAWRSHAAHDRYVTLPASRSITGRILEGAHIQRHLFWRYSLRWTRPE